MSERLMSVQDHFTVEHKDNYKFGQEGYDVEKYTGDMVY